MLIRTLCVEARGKPCNKANNLKIIKTCVFSHLVTTIQIISVLFILFSQVAFCLEFGLFPNDNIYTESIVIALSYDLPNATIRDPQTHRLEVPFMLRRNRRNLYQSLEVTMNSWVAAICLHMFRGIPLTVPIVGKRVVNTWIVDEGLGTRYQASAAK
jgi:hypothetical protein